MAKFPSNAAYLGAVHPASEKGFAAMVKEANDAETKGYERVASMALENGTKIGVIYKRRTETETSQGAQLVDDFF